MGAHVSLGPPRRHNRRRPSVALLGAQGMDKALGDLREPTADCRECVIPRSPVSAMCDAHSKPAELAGHTCRRATSIDASDLH